MDTKNLKIKKNVKKATQLDPDNLRAYYVHASNDYYTPEQYGGGKEAESLLKKAIALPEQKVKNNYLPSWGKEDAYILLTELYIKREKWTEAKTVYAEGIALYPESYMLNRLASKLIGK